MLRRKERTRDILLPLLGLVFTGGLFWFLTLVRNEDPYLTLDKSWSRSIYDSDTFSNPLMVTFSRLGSGFFTVPLGLMLYLSYRKTGNLDKSKLILFNVLGIRILNAVFKLLFKRKPPEWERLIKASKYGYPSAHTMNAAGFYGLLLFLSGMWKNIWALFGSCVFLMMIGVSRVKLGIHYILDMIAGLTGGLFLCLLGTKTYKLFLRR